MKINDINNLHVNGDYLHSMSSPNLLENIEIIYHLFYSACPDASGEVTLHLLITFPNSLDLDQA